eukprot:2729080-Pleurochrysis_carterae.AAC.1
MSNRFTDPFLASWHPTISEHSTISGRVRVQLTRLRRAACCSRRRMAEFPMDPQLSKMLIAADSYGVTVEVRRRGGVNAA